MKGKIKTVLIWIIFIVIILFAVNYFQYFQQERQELTYSDFLDELNSNNIESLTIKGQVITGKLREGVVKNFRTIIPLNDDKIYEIIRSKNVNVRVELENERGIFNTFLYLVLPIGIMIFLWILFIRQIQGTNKNAIAFGKSRARLFTQSNKNKVTFADVAGVEEAKEELKEIVEFLKSPEKFRRLGGKIPKGVLLVGPPGTGKTLLARAIAGEANVPFFSISGSDFVEMFVGVGAARVRDLFEQGKKNAPCLIFVDEIDAVGRHRGSGLGGGHDEREQTLNQLLVEMDGFDSNDAIILIAATNRPDILDPALLRPGRFDRQIYVDIPDVKGRREIFKVHTRNIPIAEDVDFEVLAKGTPGFTGADIATLVNEAALLAARKNKDKVEMEDFEQAKDKVLMGVERRSILLNEEERRLTAYHESGHTLVAYFSENIDPIHKVSIIPRGRALGVTQLLPEDNRFMWKREYVLDVIKYALGGRAAEEIVFNTITNGAKDDIQKATELARRMVCDWGMSEKIGPVAFGKDDEPIFIGKELVHKKAYSEKTAQLIDSEIQSIIIGQYNKAKNLLLKYNELLHILAKNLLEKEVLNKKEIDEIINNYKETKVEKA